MGNSYYKPITQFSKGEYTGANQKQDDATVIRQYIPSIPADGGTSSANAVDMPTESTTSSNKTTVMRGIIDNPTNADWYSFVSGKGSMVASVAITPSNGFMRADLDVQLRVYYLDGQTAIATGDPSTCFGTSCANAPLSSMAATVALDLPNEGKYYISVRGAGGGDPLTSGYSSYGSLGQYTLRATFPLTAAATPSPSPPPLSPSPPPPPSPSPPPPPTSPPPSSPPPSPSPPPPSPPPSGVTVGASVPTATVYSSSRKGKVFRASVVIRDSAGKGVSGAYVVAKWSNVAGTSTLTTTSTGTASGWRSANVAPGVRATFTVTSVSGTKMIWNKVQQAVTVTG